MKALIPEHEEGVKTNTETAARFDTEDEAAAFYAVARQRLLRVNCWHEWAGAASAVFQLTDKEGKEIDRSPEPDDHFRIGSMAPASQAGEGYDWVQVEAIDEQPQCTSIRVRPASNPLNEEKEIAHFFAPEATSSFVVKLQGKEVIAGVYGRNEKPNVDTEKLVDKIRNAAVAVGAITGFAKLQWKGLVNGIVDRDASECKKD